MAAAAPQGTGETSSSDEVKKIAAELRKSEERSLQGRILHGAAFQKWLRNKPKWVIEQGDFGGWCINEVATGGGNILNPPPQTPCLVITQNSPEGNRLLPEIVP